MNFSRTLLLGPPTRSIGCPGVDLSPCEFPKARSGAACGEMTARRQGVDYNCEQQGLFIPFILPDMLSLLKANVGKIICFSEALFESGGWSRKCGLCSGWGARAPAAVVSGKAMC